MLDNNNIISASVPAAVEKIKDIITNEQHTL